MFDLLVSRNGKTLGRHALQSRTVLIGRDTCSDVVLDDARVSGQHLVLFVDGDGSVRFQDLGSKNHTLVNGHITSHRTLTSDDLLDVCGFELRLCPCASGVDRGQVSVRPVRADPPVETATALSLRPDHFERSSKDQQRLQWLKQMASEICSVLDHGELLDRILDAVFDTFDAQRAFIGILARQGREFEFHVSRKRGEPSDASWAPSHTILDMTLTRQQPVLTTDALSDTRFREATSVQSCAIRSAMCVPVVRSDALLGVIYVDNMSAPKTFGEDDVSYLSTLAHFAAIALANSTAYRHAGSVAEGLRQELDRTHSIFCVSPAMKEVLHRAKQIASSECNAMVLGETGSGKELIAREIHRLSPRSRCLFVAVNCAHSPETLIESELFGHVKGAFSGAIRDRKGKFQQADGGTLFLDEIGDMSLAAQAKVLRAIQFGDIERLGDERVTHVNVRILAATNKDLEAETQAGRFRKDLLFRLNVATLKVPPLRERKEDVPLLASAFLDRLRAKYGGRIAQVSYAAMKVLLAHHWPGNVRELENAIEYAMIVCQEDAIRPEHLPSSVRSGRVSQDTDLLPLAEAEKRHVQHVLAVTEWNVTRAAEILDVPRRTMHQKIRDFGLQRPE